jgi:O-antigen/teichoic acid export membrane protein
MTEPPSGPASLRERVLRGVAWTTSAAILVQISRMAVGIILIRLLSPHEYGIAAMAFVFSALVLAVSDFGLGTALVQRSEITEADKSTAFWTSTLIGCMLAGAGVALAEPVAAFYGEPEVESLFVVVSLVFILAGAGKTHAALFQRDMAFRAISARLVAGTVAGGAVGIYLAARGHGAWSLVWMQVANGGVTTLLMWFASPWQPRLIFSLASLRSLAGFGFNIFGSKIMEYLHGNADKILVGRFLGSGSLGFYSVAYNLVVLPWLALILALTDGVFPAMARFQDDVRRVAEAWLNATRIVVAIAAPAMLGLIVVAPDFVTVVLGDQWRPAVAVLQLMALAMAIHSVIAFGTSVLIARDRTGAVLRFNVAEVLTIVVALAIGLQWGITGVAATYVAAIAATRSYLAWYTARSLGLTAAAFVRSFAGVAQAAVGMMLIAWAVRSALLEADAPAALRLALVPLAGALAYPPLCLWRSPELRSLAFGAGACWIVRQRGRVALDRL